MESCNVSKLKPVFVALPERSLFLVAVSTNEKGYSVTIRLTEVDSFSKEAIICQYEIGIKARGQTYLAQGCMVVSDGLKCFRALEEQGGRHKVIVTGGGPESVRFPEFRWVSTIIGNVKRSVHGCFHPVSKKHFHHYFAEYCYRFNRRSDLRQMIPRFCYVALRTKPCPQRLLQVYG